MLGRGVGECVGYSFGLGWELRVGVGVIVVGNVLKGMGVGRGFGFEIVGRVRFLGKYSVSEFWRDLFLYGVLDF